MIRDVLPVCVVLLSLIPGALCKYDYSVGGLVAAAVSAFFLLMLIVIMLFVIVMWRDWYERKQNMKGIPKRRRRYWGIFSTRSKSPSVLLSTPKSDRKHLAGNNHVLIRDSRNTTLTRADEWLNKMPQSANGFLHPGDKYEEKVKVMNFEPEEEAIIVADILPSNDGNFRAPHKSGNVDYDYPTERNIGSRATQKSVHVEYEHQPERNMGSSYRVIEQSGHMDFDNTTEMNMDYQTVNHSGRREDKPFYVSYNEPKTNYESRQLRHTVASTPYHVKMRRIDDDDMPHDQYIAPPAMMSMSNEPAVTSYDPVDTTTSYAPVVTSSANDPAVTYTFSTNVQDEVPAEIPGPSGIGRSSPVMVVNEDPDRPAVMTFPDSDEEAGMIPNTQVQVENDVLF